MRLTIDYSFEAQGSKLPPRVEKLASLIQRVGRATQGGGQLP